MRRFAKVLVVLAAAASLAGCSGGEAVTMPNVVGKQLDVAISDVKRAGIDDEVEVLGGGMFGILDESNWTVCVQEPAGGAEVSSAPRVTVERTCETGDGPKPTASETQTETPSTTPTPKPALSPTQAYRYQGPKYETVVVDRDQTSAKLSQYWIYTSAIDVSKPAYKDQVKMILADIAHTEGSGKLLAEVVKDREIALAESPSTYEAFIAEHGEKYAIITIPQKEKEGWIASYSGGYDFNAGEASDSADAFEVIWRPSANAEFEKWKPSTVG